MTAAIVAPTYAQEVITDTGLDVNNGTNTTDVQPNPQREMYIYGAPGDEDYGEPRTADDVMRLEAMWEIDAGVQKWRGNIQGFKRGFYQLVSFRIPETCLDKTVTK